MQINKIQLGLIFGFGLLSIGIGGETVKANPSLDSILARDARNAVHKLEVGPGQITLIDVPENEVVVQTAIGDRSKFVYSLDSEIGQAQGVLIRQIEELDFPGELKAVYQTNLLITTQDQWGQTHRYFFDLVPINYSPEFYGINLETREQVNAPENNKQGAVLVSNPASPNGQRYWNTSMGKATVTDIQRGLNIAINRGYTKPDDPIVLKVKNWMAMVQNGSGVIAALDQQGFDPGVLTVLGELGLSQLRVAPQPQNNSPEWLMDFIDFEED